MSQKNRPPAQVTAPAGKPACQTCPFWQAQGYEKGICRGVGPVGQIASGAVWAVTSALDWCRLHPLAPK